MADEHQVQALFRLVRGALRRMNLAYYVTDKRVLQVLGHDAAARLGEHVRQHAGRQYAQAEAAAKAAVPLVTAMTALRAGDYDTVVEALWPVRYDLSLIGGSHAQRDLFEEMLAWSAIRSRHHDLARNLLAERVAAKPSSAWGWKIYAAALNRAGDSLAAHRASEQAQRIIADYH
ncbi:MAG: hypothetical protein ACPGVX_08360 [Thalassobaculaceae bacterium]